jgi:hypothetical protein|tara:strand:- start:282 stop:464 length:183 start_codon:yes stop_codon:yes gene_type:complete
MTVRTLKDGSTVKEFDKAITLSVRTRSPEKWKLIDLETGEEYIGNTPNNSHSLSWNKINA